MALRGARYLHVLVPCPLGWGSAPSDTIRARPPGHTRRACSRCSRPSTARSTAVSPIRRRVPVEEYLRAPAPLSPPLRRDRRRGRPDVVARSRPWPTATSPATACSTDEPRRTRRDGASPSPSPSTSGSSLANKTGSWRVERPVYVDRLPPCNDACPAGENIQRWLYHAEEGDYEAAWRPLVEDNPLPAVMGRVCYHPCETACNRAQLDEAVGHQRRRALPRATWPSSRAGRLPRRRRPTPGKRVLVVGSGPAGLSRRLPPAPARPRRDDASTPRRARAA